MAKDYDVIVIGAGNGGLAAAAYTAKNGLKTLVVEKHNIPGGSATSFKRGRFEFETSLHEMCNLGTAENPGGVWKIFEMLGAEVEWCTSMEETFHLVVPEEGIDARMPCGIPQFVGKLEELVPGSKESMMQVVKLGAMAAQAYREMDVPDFDRKAFEEKYPDFFKIAGHSVHEVLDSLGMPEKAQKIISTYWCYLGANYDELDFMIYSRMLLGYIVFGAGMPRMRSHEISLAIEKVIRDNGGEIWYNTEIKKILVKDGKAYGVVIGEKEYYADFIISNAYPDAVYGSMIDAAQVPERAVKLTNSRKLGLNFVTVYLGMNRTAEELGIPAYSNFIARTGDSAVLQKNATDTREYSGFVIMNCPDMVISGASEEGTCQLFYTTLFYGNGWDDMTEDEYFEFKNKIAAEMIKHSEEALGIKITPYIEEIVIATPVTFARYLNSPEGTPYGYQANMVDAFVQRKLADTKEQFIDGLYFAGAATKRGDGYSSTYSSGIDAGASVLAKVKEKGGIER